MLRQKNRYAVGYLENIPGGDDVWALYKQIGKNIPMYGHRTSNVIESENSRYHTLRELTPINFLDAIIKKQCNILNERRNLVKKFNDEGYSLTKAAADKY